LVSSSWNYEFAVENSDAVNIGQQQSMTRAAEPDTESSIVIPKAGNYVYSFTINDIKNGEEMMVSLCE
jgi:hypothetical protein